MSTECATTNLRKMIPIQINGHRVIEEKHSYEVGTGLNLTNIG
jgi:hypothetical protein